METKKVVLADSSYTIRRITELSFSEEEGIELITLENGFNIKEKLIELKPAVVLIDIKLSGFNGYDTCKFINETESLKETMVFLMKGGFEPVNEGLLKGLKYIDIITKPFDSNELVSSIKEMLDKDSVKAPPIVPDDLPEIDSIEEAEDGISFSDIEEELKSEKIISEDLEKEELYSEEVLPSEEITQGTQIDKESSLDVNTFDTDEIENPFKEETEEKPEVEKEEEKIEEEVKEEIKVEEKTEKIEPSDEFFEAEETEEKPEVDKEKEKVVEEEVKEEIKFEEKTEKIEPSGEFFEAEETEEKLEVEKEEELDRQSVEEKVKDFFAASEVKETEEKLEEEIKIEEEVDKLEVSVAKEEVESIEGIDQKQKEELVEKVEDKLTLAVKEILWEIVPSLADKIIKEEIEKIKADINIEVE